MRDDFLIGGRHPLAHRLKVLLRDRAARRGEGAFVVEGPRAIEAALDRDAELEAVYFGPLAAVAFPALYERIHARSIDTFELREGVLEKVGTTVTPQPILAVAPLRAHAIADFEGLALDRPVLVCVQVADPGNAGTMLRSAEAAGMAGVVFCGGSVDPYNPKVVRASAGAMFGVSVMEADDPVEVLEALGAQGRRRLAARVSGGRSYDTVDLTGPVALVFGNEARGLDRDLPVDEVITIPMAGSLESINVAMAATILCFESGRQARGGSRDPEGELR